MGFICHTEGGFKVNIITRGVFRIVKPGCDLGMLQVTEKLSDTFDMLRDMGHYKLCLDLREAPIIDSSVIGLIVKHHQLLQGHGGELVVLSERNPAMEAMLRLQLRKLLRIIESESEL